MKIERIIWIVLVIVLSTLLVNIYSRYASLEESFLTRQVDEPYKAAAINLFIKQEGATMEMISDSFYVSHIGFSDRSCIRFVPKPKVYGGATTYCFKNGSPLQLIGVDREAE